MDFLEIAKKRYSCRNYTDNKIEKEKLDLILEAGRIAPTGSNVQPFKALVIQNNEGLDKLKKSMNTFNAPCAIVLCANPDKAWTRSYDGKKITDIDASIVLTHMMLEATNQGLDNVWVCNFRPDILRTEFNVPSEYEITSVLLIGYGVSEPLSPQRHDKTRKKTEDLFIFETF